MKIYTIYGLTGEYSDRQEWTVKSFSDKAKAEEFKWHLIQYLIGLGFKTDSRWENDEYYVYQGKSQNRYNIGHPLDPEFQCDYTGTKYLIGEQELD